MKTRKNNIFKEVYSDYYDLIYKRKDYRNECQRILNFLKKKKVNKVLEIGCGTCSHSIILAKENFQIVGIDSSEEMLKVAKKKNFTSQRLKYSVNRGKCRKNQQIDS